MKAPYRIVSLVAAAAVAWVVEAGLVASDRPAAPDETESVRDVFLLLDRGPLHIRLRT